jgi:hypothetical protein
MINCDKYHAESTISVLRNFLMRMNYLVTTRCGQLYQVADFVSKQAKRDLHRISPELIWLFLPQKIGDFLYTRVP